MEPDHAVGEDNRKDGKMNVLDKVNRKRKKLRRKLKKMRLRPISVFLFHQVSEEFDGSTMYSCDWTEISQFKCNIEALKKKYRFISLEKAYSKMRSDVFRFRNYAVLTSDDGWASLKNILPWLREQNIPVTFFLNPGYFDGVHFREKATERYLLEADIQDIDDNYHNVSFGMHGWEHVRATDKDEKEFSSDLERTMRALQVYKRFVSFYAYTWGKHNAMNGKVLREFGIVPVLIDNEKNLDDLSCIHRELLDGKKL